MSVRAEHLDTACRVCLLTDQNNHNIFRDPVNDGEAKIEDVFTLSQKLQLYGGIEIWEKDGLPEKICTLCVAKISVAHDFRDQCQKADETLRKLCGKPLKKPSPISLKGQKDQHCQTDNLLLLSFIEQQQHHDSSMKPITDVLIQEDNAPNKTYIEGLRCDGNLQHVEIAKPKFDISHKWERTDMEKNSIKKEVYRTRKLSMFKQMTSIENLKSHKEKQRQYIKKNGNMKLELNEADVGIGKRYRGKKNWETALNVESHRSYDCTECNRSHSTKKSLDKHLLTHHEKNLKCEKCNKKFCRQDKLMEHSKLHVQSIFKPNLIACNICNKTFRKTETMIRHLNVHKKANPIEVFTILKDMRDRRKMDNAVQTFGIEKNSFNGDEKNILHKEGDKNENDVDSNQINDHFSMPNLVADSNDNSPNSRSHGDKKTLVCSTLKLYDCERCEKRYPSKKALQRHMLIHEEKKYLCNVCNMKFFRPDRLKSHRDRYGHGEDENCSEVQKPPDNKLAIKLINSWIKEELVSDNEGKGFPCETCGKSYATKKSLQKHKSNMHKSNHACGHECKCVEKETENSDTKITKVKPYNCDECKKSFEKESKLEKHLRIHERAKEQQNSNFKRFLCHICSKTFRQNTGLMFHMRTHTGYKPHVCKYCGRGFTSNSNCINHERTHTGDRPFVCHFCSAAFAKSCTLKAHITTHTGEANYHCKTCGKSFRRLKYLKEHRFTHTGEKPYACKICGTAYSHSGSLFVHEKKCKAQYNAYQNVPPQNYTQPQTTISTPLVMTPIIPTLSSSHHFSSINHPLGAHTSKSYVESVHKMSAHAAAVGNPVLHMHSNSDIADMASAVRNFAVIGQIFHS